MACLQGLTFTALLLLVRSQVDSTSCQRGSKDEACASAMLQVKHWTKPKTARVVHEDEATEVLKTFRMLGQDDHVAASKKTSRGGDSDNSGSSKKKEALKNQRKQKGTEQQKSKVKKGSLAQAKKAPLHKSEAGEQDKSDHVEEFGPLGKRQLIEEGLTVSGSVSNQRSGLHEVMKVTRARLQEARQCLPRALLNSHVAALRHEASRLDHLLGLKEEPATAHSASLHLIDMGAKPSKHTTKGGAEDPDGASAPLNAAGFKAVTSRCCPQDMEIFFERLLGSMNLQMCSKPHVQGLMHWFSCVPDMDFTYLVDVVNNGNPCKYWAAKGGVCPSLSPECEGEWCR